MLKSFSRQCFPEKEKKCKIFRKNEKKSDLILRRWQGAYCLRRIPYLDPDNTGGLVASQISQ
jgi:hypothetical protein